MSGFNITGFFDDLATAASNGIDYLDESLDFGFDDDTIDVIKGEPIPVNRWGERGRSTPEVDLTEVERASPTDTNAKRIAGLPAPVVYVGLGLLAFLALKAAKVI